VAGDGGWSEDIDAAVAEVFRGSPEAFVARRDALVKELRGAGQADDAAAVKRLRKPTRTVWALDAAVLDHPDLAERVAAAVLDMFAAQTGRGDARDASGELRDAVRDLAAAAARAAAADGHPVDQAALVPLVMTVISDAEAFEALRAGHLVEVPASGGFDVLAGTPPRAPASRAPRGSTAVEEPGAEAEAADPAAIAAAEGAVREAEAAAEAARDRAEAAEQTVADAEQQSDEAETRLRAAEDQVRQARGVLRQAQQEARAANQAARDADRAAALARANLDDLTR